jgi:hypothetical protein
VLAVRRAGEGAVSFDLRAGNQASAKPSEVLRAVFEGLDVRRLVKEEVVFSPRAPPEPEKSE